MEKEGLFSQENTESFEEKNLEKVDVIIKKFDALQKEIEELQPAKVFRPFNSLKPGMTNRFIGQETSSAEGWSIFAPNLTGTECILIRRRGMAREWSVNRITDISVQGARTWSGTSLIPKDSILDKTNLLEVYKVVVEQLKKLGFMIAETDLQMLRDIQSGEMERKRMEERLKRIDDRRKLEEKSRRKKV